MKILLILVLILSGVEAFSQELIKKNEIFAELGGNGLLGSINYYRQFGDKPGFGARIGAGVYGNEANLTIPVEVNYLIRVLGNHSFLDLGLGATFTKANVHLYALAERSEGYVEKKPFAFFIPSIGLRAYTTKNYVWHVNITPIQTEYSMLPYFGLGFGKRF